MPLKNTAKSKLLKDFSFTDSKTLLKYKISQDYYCTTSS